MWTYREEGINKRLLLEQMLQGIGCIVNIITFHLRVGNKLRMSARSEPPFLLEHFLEAVKLPKCTN